MTFPYRLAFHSALLVEESSWLFLALGLVGLWVQGPILSLPAVLALMALGLVAARSVNSLGIPLWLVEVLGAWVGVVAIYGVLSLQMGSFWWVGRFARPDTSVLELIRMGLAGAAAIGLWWRGTQFAGSWEPWAVLSFSFRMGLLVVVAVGIVDIFVPQQLVGQGVLFLFVGASLAGLAFAHLMEVAPGKEGGSWARAVGVSVALVLVGGLLASLLSGGPLALLLRRLLGYLGVVVQAILAVILVPLFYIVDFVMRGIFTFLRWLSPGQPQQPPQPQPDDFLENLRKGVTEGQGIPSWIVALGKWALVALLVAAVLYLLARALLRPPRPHELDVEEERESVRDEADPRGDLASLMLRLLPYRGHAAEQAKLYIPPEGDDPRTRAARVYYRLLNAATLWGFPRLAWETPLEYQHRMTSQLPDAVITSATSLFNRAWFGWVAPSQEELEQAEREVEESVQRRSGVGAR